MTLTVKLTAEQTAFVEAEVRRRTLPPSEVARELIADAVARRSRVDRAIDEVLTENAELYRRLA